MVGRELYLVLISEERLREFRKKRKEFPKGQILEIVSRSLGLVNTYLLGNVLRAFYEGEEEVKREITDVYWNYILRLERIKIVGEKEAFLEGQSRKYNSYRTEGEGEERRMVVGVEVFPYKTRGKIISF